MAIADGGGELACGCVYRVRTSEGISGIKGGGATGTGSQVPKAKVPLPRNAFGTPEGCGGAADVCIPSARRVLCCARSSAVRPVRQCTGRAAAKTVRSEVSMPTLGTPANASGTEGGHTEVRHNAPARTPRRWGSVVVGVIVVRSCPFPGGWAVSEVGRAMFLVYVRGGRKIARLTECTFGSKLPEVKPAAHRETHAVEHARRVLRPTPARPACDPVRVTDLSGAPIDHPVSIHSSSPAVNGTPLPDSASRRGLASSEAFQRVRRSICTLGGP